ncbi:MAG: UDP-4-amino-4,6-dideoxy-N-acetyl-beta-L-altrosamine transaminase [Alphaproteobacteria bacterium]|nr:UDP-4-amino-4,6-dideoxy-N-acetyl-beta-L-altrosamine transaminase [Alphaproteobacteria bacterium]
MIPYGRQDISDADIEAVVEVLRSDWLTQGPAVPAFEQAVAERCRVGFAVAVNSGTSALEVACQALGLGPGKRLWTVPNTFVASANCARRCGADVDFVDIAPDTRNLSPEALSKKLREAEKNNALPDVVVAVHFAGHSCDMELIAELAGTYGFRVIEDATHALGGTYKDAPVGSCRWSDIAVFSFHPVKIIAAGEGGMALTNDAGLAENMRMRRNHGITKDANRMKRPDDGPWYYEQHFLGANYRLTDLQAALGRSQLQRLDAFLDRRRAIVKAYHAAFAGIDAITLPVERPDTASAWHLYAIHVNGTSEKRRALFERLQADGLGVQVHYLPVHLQPYYRELGFGEGDFPAAEDHAARAISLPIFPAMTDDDIQTVVAITTKACADLL